LAFPGETALYSAILFELPYRHYAHRIPYQIATPDPPAPGARLHPGGNHGGGRDHRHPRRAGRAEADGPHRRIARDRRQGRHLDEQGLQALVAKPTAGPAANGWKAGGYVERLPKDPWGNAYQYLSPGIHGEVDLFSLGADGQPGGAGEDADIGSWEN
jgi:hypothetical protein